MTVLLDSQELLKGLERFCLLDLKGYILGVVHWKESAKLNLKMRFEMSKGIWLSAGVVWYN